MENYTITKEQILELAKRDVNQYQLNEWFPEAFKKELEVGKWYKRPNNSALFYVTEILNIDSNHCKVFGFDNLGNWMPENAKTFPDNDFEATPQEVEAALIAEAKKRGFVEGVKINNTGINYFIGEIRSPISGIFNYFEGSNILDSDNGVGHIFENGKWSEIITEETKEITMDKAVKILSKKYGQKVEIK